MKKYLILAMFALIGLNNQNMVGVESKNVIDFNNLTKDISQNRNKRLFGGEQVQYLNALGALIIQEAADLAFQLYQISEKELQAIDGYVQAMAKNYKNFSIVQSAYQKAIFSFQEQYDKTTQRIGYLIKKGHLEHTPEQFERSGVGGQFLDVVLEATESDYKQIINALRQLKAKPQLPQELTLESLKAIAKDVKPVIQEKKHIEAFIKLTQDVNQKNNQLRFGGKQVWYLNALGASMLQIAAEKAYKLALISPDEKTKIDEYLKSLVEGFYTPLVQSATQYALSAFRQRAAQESPADPSAFKQKTLQTFNALTIIFNRSYTQITDALEKLKAKPKRLPKICTLRSLKKIAKEETDFSNEYE